MGQILSCAYTEIGEQIVMNRHAKRGIPVCNRPTSFVLLILISIRGELMPGNSMYNRQKAVEYAHKWAFKRNPAYIDFSAFGGDCTNFISQCIHAGDAAMNYTPIMGWFYINASNRAPAWSGVEQLYQFLTTNERKGPYAVRTTASAMQPGDIVQLTFNGISYGHSLFVVSVGSRPDNSNILIATHTFDSDNRPLDSWNDVGYRYLHILGVR